MSSLGFIQVSSERPIGTPIFSADPVSLGADTFQKEVEDNLKERNANAMSIPIRECGQELVNVTEIQNVVMAEQVAALGLSAEETPPLIRSGIAQRVEDVQKTLREHGLGLRVFYALRPRAVQARLFDKAKAHIREERPDLAEAGNEVEIVALASKYVAPVDLAPHCTGAAIDLGVRSLETDQDLDFGTGFPDFVPKTMTEHPLITGEAMTNRVALRQLMADNGFWNYPGEWWHFSFGDRAEVSYRGGDYAIYGPVAEAG